MGNMKEPKEQSSKHGIVLFPNPIKRSQIRRKRDVLVIKECYCQNGHNLVTDQAIFDSHRGIVLKVKKDNKEGLVALSPLYGYKSRVSFGLSFYTDEVWEPLCPECGERLPTVSTCECESEMFSLFLDKNADFANCMILCSRVDCEHSELRYKNKTVSYNQVKGLIRGDIPKEE